jgi:hypothetical protein
MCKRNTGKFLMRYCRIKHAKTSENTVPFYVTNTVRSESRCAPRLRYLYLVASTEVLKCAVVSLYSVVKQWLKCNTGELRNCLIQFILTRFCANIFQYLVHSDYPNALYFQLP